VEARRRAAGACGSEAAAGVCGNEVACSWGVWKRGGVQLVRVVARRPRVFVVTRWLRVGVQLGRVEASGRAAGASGRAARACGSERACSWGMWKRVGVQLGRVAARWRAAEVAARLQFGVSRLAQVPPLTRRIAVHAQLDTIQKRRHVLALVLQAQRLQSSDRDIANPTTRGIAGPTSRNWL